jgi:ATP-dependent DNA helicase HFM1/MER3
LSIALGKGSKRISDNTHRAALADARSKASDYNLKQALSTGTAFHHAGLHSSDRHLVESLFMKNLIKVLCATSTLAMGVNLPAHLVVIKGTRCWRGGGSGGTSGHQDIDIATLTQMIGRAGRPGLDTSGVAVVMTDNRSKPMYEKKIEGSEVIESMLRSTIIETLNAEISQHVIKDVPTALLWIKSTFYYIR